MRKHIFTTFALLPLLLSFAQAAQSWGAEQTWTIGTQPFGIPSEDSGNPSYLGVDIADISADRLGALKLKEEKGVEVTMVDQDAPAGKAGIKEHDVILTMNGTPIESKSQLQRMIHETPAGRLVTLGLSRDGLPLSLKVQLGDRHSEFPHIAKSKDKDGDFHFEMPPMPDMHDFEVPNISVVYVHSPLRSGLMVENITPQLGEFFGAKNGGGVLVRSVEKGSRAEKAGLRAGDVIVRVGDQPVHDTSDFTHSLHSRNGGSVNVEVLRDKKSQTLTLTLPERKESGSNVEESLELPELDAETQIELSHVADEVARLQPQMELVRHEALKAACEARKAVRDQQKQMREQARKLRDQLSPQVLEEIQKGQKELQEEMENLRLEMSSFLDI